MASASDTSLMSWGLQLAVADRMGLPLSDALSSLEAAGGAVGSSPFSSVGVAVGLEPGAGPSSLVGAAQEIADSPAVKAYVDQVYSNTQSYLADRGITEIAAYRGVYFDVSSGKDYPEPSFDFSKDPLYENSTQDYQSVDLNPVSSFSLTSGTAVNFAHPDQAPTNSYVISATVPAERVFSIPPTGPGCLSEDELLVVGGSGVVVGVVSITNDVESGNWD
jgi:hypothetical protein